MNARSVAVAYAYLYIFAPPVLCHGSPSER